MYRDEFLAATSRALRVCAPLLLAALSACRGGGGGEATTTVTGDSGGGSTTYSIGFNVSRLRSGLVLELNGGPESRSHL